MAYSYDANSPWLSQTLPEGFLEKMLSGQHILNSPLAGGNTSGSTYYQYIPRFQSSQTEQGEVTSDTGQDDYIRGPQDNGLYGMWDKTGKFLGYGSANETGGVLSEMIVPLVAATAMYFGLPPSTLGVDATAGIGATQGAGMTAAEAWGSGAGLGGDTLGAMGLGEGAAASGAGSSGLYSLAGSQTASGTAGLGNGLSATAGPGMNVSGTTGLGMSSGANMTSGLSGVLNSAGAAGGTGSLLSSLGAAGQAASGASGLSNLFSDPKDLQSMVALGSGIGGLIDSQNKQDAINTNTNNFMNRWDSFYAPGSNEYNLLKQEMERKDAAAGRNSQYGTRLAEMGGRIAQAKFNSLSSMYGVANNGVQAANAVGSGLGQLAGGIGTAAQNGTLSKIFGGQ